jgi:ADP-heptose:LPS heptosyltransferase
VDEFDGAIFLKSYPALFSEFLRVSSRWKVHPRDPRLNSRSPYQPHISLWGEERVHQALQLLQIVSAVTGKRYRDSDLVFPPLQFTEEDKQALPIVFPTGVPSAYWVAHPFANFETRRYPMEYWNTVLAELHRKTGFPVVVVGSPGDPALSSAPGLIQAQGKLSIGQTALLISHSKGFLGNLSGPAHLAGALGIPTVTLMSGHSAPSEWAPRGKSLVLRADVPCAPCHQWSCPGYGLACLKELTPDRVLPELIPFLAGS